MFRGGPKNPPPSERLVELAPNPGSQFYDSVTGELFCPYFSIFRAHAHQPSYLPWRILSDDPLYLCNFFTIYHGGLVLQDFPKRRDSCLCVSLEPSHLSS